VLRRVLRRVIAAPLPIDRAARGDLAELAERGCRPRIVTLVDEGGLAAAAARATALCEAALVTAAAARREPIPLAELVLGTECGGSDANSGLTANPAVGVCADELVAAGGTVILAEMTELIGAEHELAERAETPELAARIVGAVGRWERFALEFGEDITGGNPCHGNIVGGITTIEEKSLGCVRKSGHGTVVDLVGFAEPSPRRGLVVMDTSGDDLEQLIAMTAGGANVIVFTTGRGTPTASPVVPTVKVSTTSALAARLCDMIDFDAGGVLAGSETLAQAGRRLLCDVVAVAGGRDTSAERGGQRDFALPVTAAGA
jgi:altronate dehydratase large subunit